MQYTLKELFDNLEITLTELSRRSGISDVTLISIRNGKSARRSTINTLLRTFSELYSTKLTLKNVSGIIIQGKPVGVEQAPIPTVSSAPPYEPAKISSPQIRTTEAKKRTPSQTSAKKSKDTGLPAGAILATDFANMHKVDPRTFRDHMTIGIGPKGSLIHGPGVPEDGSVLVKDWVRYEERNKRVRKDGTIEKERYLTSDQQLAAIQFWGRHDVSFSQCERPECPCH